MDKSFQLKTFLASGIVASSLALSGCGGGGGSSDEIADNTSSRGLITGFGSVYVNGIKYETDDARYDIDDDDSANEDDLRVGMMVTVSGEIDDNGKTGRASHIAYENELKGPISTITPDTDPTMATLTILGQAVLVDGNTTFDDDHGFSFATMTVGDVVEVSGFTTQAGITATHIEKQDDDTDIEIVGEIANLTTTSFEIKGFNISYDGNTDIEDNATLVDGLYVEVEGVLDGAGTTLIAEEIEAKTKGLGDDMDEAEIQGVISAYNAADNTFLIQGQLVDASNAELSPSSLTLANGLTVEAEGSLVNGVLIAGEVEQKGQKIKIEALLSAVDAAAGTVTFTFVNTNIVARVNQQTELEDDVGSGPLTLAGLNVGDYVEMEAFNDGSADINAVELKRKNIDEVKIQGPVESFDKATQMITLLGVSFDLSAVTSYEDDDDNNISVDDFYAALAEGVFVELKDEAIGGDGVIDKAELED